MFQIWLWNMRCHRHMSPTTSELYFPYDRDIPASIVSFRHSLSGGQPIREADEIDFSGLEFRDSTDRICSIGLPTHDYIPLLGRLDTDQQRDLRRHRRPTAL